MRFTAFEAGFSVRRISLLTAVAALATALVIGVALGSHDLASPAKPSAREAYGRLPLSFVRNEGQVDRRVSYYTQSSGANFYFTKRKAVLAITKGKRGAALELGFPGANANARLVADSELAGKVNYQTAASRHTNLPTYAQVVYRDLWPGIDLAFRGGGGKLKYEFRVAAGADPRRIRLAYKGTDSLRLGAGGGLSIDTPLGVMHDSAPRSYQPVAGHTRRVESLFALVDSSTYGFTLGRYDHTRPLVIDPGLAYSTYLGGTPQPFEGDAGLGVAVDASGHAYVTGRTASADFPTTSGAFDETQNGGDVFVSKLSSSGSSLVYSTFFGGATNSEDSGSIAVDAAGSAYFTGTTLSSDLPTTTGAFDTTYNGGNGGDAYIAKLNPSGSALVYSSYLGGSNGDGQTGLAIDSSGSAYVTGRTSSTDFPTTPGAFDTTYGGNAALDGFVTKLNPAGSSLAYSTFLGGAASDSAIWIAVDQSGSAYVTGSTTSTDFPTTLGAFDTTHNGGSDVFISKLNAAGSGLSYSTFLGGTGSEAGWGIAVDPNGSAYVTGSTSGASFPATAGAFDTTPNGGDDGFVAKVDATSTVLDYSTLLGGAGTDHGFAIALDQSGSAYVSGETVSADFPTTADAFDTTQNSPSLYDAFVSKLNAAGTGLAYSTFLGGGVGTGGASGGVDESFAIAVDLTGSAYVTGQTWSTDFPTTPSAFDTTLNGDVDAFVTKLSITPYPRPVGASPVAVAFVPAFRPCETSAADSRHGVPLDFLSCSNPQPTSSTVRMGTNTVSIARIVVCAANSTATFCNPPGGVMPKPDVRLTGSIRDLRCASSIPPGCVAGQDYDPNTAAGPYTDAGNGKAGAQSPCWPGAGSGTACAAGSDMTEVVALPHSAAPGGGLRITDSDNGPTQTDQATVVDVPFPIPLDCLPTADPSQGSTCGVNTTANALIVGVVRSGKAAVWQLGEIQLRDSGPDGVRGNSDDELFATQGVFLP